MGYSDFGFKLGIEGEKQFKEALKEINQNFKILKSEMNLVTSEFDKNDRSVEALTARNRVLAREMDEQRNKISALEEALKNAASSFGETDKRTQAWQLQLNNAKAELNGMDRELKQNEKSIDSVGDEFSQSARQADDFDKELKQSADTADKADGKFSSLSSTLGKVGKGLGAGIGAVGAGVAAIGAAVGAAGKKLGEFTVQAAAYADDVMTQSKVTGMSTESLQAYKYAAELIDTPLENVTKTMAKNIKSMDSARKGTGAAAEAYAKLGIATTNADGSLRDGQTVYWEAIDALGKISDTTTRDATAMAIFGKSAQELNPLIEQGSAGFKKLTDEAVNMGAVMSDEQLLRLGAFDDSVQRLKSGATAAKNALGTVLLPQLQELADGGTGLLGKFASGMNAANGDFSKMADVIGETVGGFADLIIQQLPKFVEVGLNIVQALLKAILDNLPMIIQSALTIVSTLLQGLISALPQITQGAIQLLMGLVNALLDNLPAILQAALTLVITLAQGIAQSLPELIPKIVETVVFMVTTLLDNIDLLIDAALQLIMGLAQGLIIALPKLIEKIPVIIDKLISAIVNNLPLILEMGVKLVIELALGLIKAIPSLLEAIPKIIWSLIKGIGSYYANIAEAGGNMLKSIWNGFKSLIPWYWGVLSDFWGSVFRKIREFASMDKLKEIGKNMIIGLWNGIKDMTAWILDKIRGFGDSVMNGLKKIFGISSPSARFRDEIGKNLALGLGEGFTASMTKVAKEMQNAIPGNFETELSLKSRWNAGSREPGGVDTAGGGIVIQIDSFVNNRAQDVAAFAQELEFYMTNKNVLRRGTT
ncbi:MAG TPA: phage tail protein [Clostridiales bacterium]|nr:phage tail protein [Clostridiales bacterium]